MVNFVDKLSLRGTPACGRQEVTKPCPERSEGTDCEAVILRATPEGSQRDSSRSLT